MSTKTTQHAMSKRSHHANSQPPSVSPRELKAAVDAAMKKRGLTMELSGFKRRITKP